MCRAEWFWYVGAGGVWGSIVGVRWFSGFVVVLFRGDLFYVVDWVARYDGSEVGGF